MLKRKSVFAGIGVALAISMPLAMFATAAPAGAAATCQTSQNPNSASAQASLKVGCLIDLSATATLNANHIEVHDGTNASWHRGALAPLRSTRPRQRRASRSRPDCTGRHSSSHLRNGHRRRRVRSFAHPRGLHDGMHGSRALGCQHGHGHGCCREHRAHLEATRLQEFSYTGGEPAR